LGGQETTLALDSSDLIFLQALAGQLAVALDRARLVEQERHRLQAEVNELRQALRLSKLIYRSPQMEAVLTTLRRVAPTDATILVMGESGTGKELLARTIHELSPRRKKRLIVVDCGAIAASLIDSELFGHERGAYTGAQQRRIGRLAEANGGTVLLDEIGELPLEVQSKLLRFVQERQLTPVGGSRSQHVDVRVIAATNRDLAEEVKSGRFRQDLYYRLNVVKLVLPPLRERPDDISHLANHYLEIYSVQYQKPVRRMTAEAEAALLAYSWPGNVRELQNRIMQAMLLCEGEELSTAELGFEMEIPTVRMLRSDIAVTADATNGKDRTESSTPLTPEPPHSDDLWQILKDALGRQVEESLTNGPPAIALGTCLNEDFILEANAVAEGVMSRGAILLGIPETTYRRKLRKAQHHVDSGLCRRPPEWESVRRAVASIVRSQERAPEDFILRSRMLLLGQISARLPRESNRGAALMGVTPLTFRRWLSENRPSPSDLS
jgi:DNA-binding NtrC family response regulator